jgi:hypothetical protein
MRKIWLFLMILACASHSFAQAAAFNPKLKRIAVFKNGYVFTYREGEAQLANGLAYTTSMPTGVMGTVWGYTTSPPARVAQLTAGESEKKEVQRVSDLEELLLANEGLRVKVKGHDRYYEGELIALTPRRKEIAPMNAASIAPRTEGAGSYDLAVKTAEGLFVIKAGYYSQVEILGAAKLEKIVTSKENRLTFKTEGATGKVGLGVAALERGIRWIPAYRIQLQGDPVREARLELEAMVINELADLDESEVHFVVGVPHFLYKEIVSPLSLNSTFAGVSSYFQTNANIYSNAIMTQSRAGELRRREDVDTESGPVSGPEDQLPAASADELFLYRADQLSLKKGERASLRLFTLNVPCTEVYDWDVPDSTDAGYDESRPVQNLANGVWFGLKMKNQTQMPWTTAPAISFRDWKALGQDMLSFTPVGSDVFVRVSPAIEVIGKHQLEEKSRVRQIIRVGNDAKEFDELTLEGVIRVKNTKKQPVNVVLKRRVNGAVSFVSDNGVAKRQGAGVEAVNPNTNSRWELTIPPGEKELRYTYKTYIKR